MTMITETWNWRCIMRSKINSNQDRTSNLVFTQPQIIDTKHKNNFFEFGSVQSLCLKTDFSREHFNSCIYNMHTYIKKLEGFHKKKWRCRKTGKNRNWVSYEEWKLSFKKCFTHVGVLSTAIKINACMLSINTFFFSDMKLCIYLCVRHINDFNKLE